MGKWFRGVFLGVLVAIGALMISGCNSEDLITEVPPQPELVIRMGMNNSNQSAVYQGMMKFKESVETATEQRIKIKLYSSDDLGSEDEILQSMKIGTIEMACLTTGSVGRYIPEYKVFTLPYLFPNRNAAIAILEGNIGQNYLEKLNKLDLVGLTFVDNEYLQIANMVRPINGLNDLSRIKIATEDLPYYRKALDAFGADSAVYDVIQIKEKIATKELQGVAMSLDEINALDLHQSPIYISKTNHIYQPMVLVMNDKVWEALSEGDRKIIQDSAVAAKAYVKENMASVEAACETKLREKGYVINEISAEGKGPFIWIGQGLIEQAKNELGVGIVNGILYALNPAVINTEEISGEAEKE